MRVCVNARLVSGSSGGVESVVLGLAHGLSQLADDADEYLFLVYDDSYEWLAGELRNSCRPVRLGPAPVTPSWRARDWIASRAPVVRDARNAMRARAARRRPPVPASDGTVESLKAHVVHFPFQSGFLTTIPTIYQPHDLQHLHLPENFTRYEFVAQS